MKHFRYLQRFSKFARKERAMLRRPRRPTKRTIIEWSIGTLIIVIFFHVWLHITNPYAAFSTVEQPYVTKVENGQITVEKKFNLQAFSSPMASALGYYRSGFLIVQNAWFGSYKAESKDADGIIRDIHELRFDPAKPYLISGDQFSVLYPRNLGVFYNTLLNHDTAHSQQDWENRQRIYLQSALYALDAFSKEKQIMTTVVPISSKGVLLTQVHPGSVASDSLYGVLYALDGLSDPSKKVQTVATTRQIISERKSDLKMLLDIYLRDVRDPETGLIKRGLHMASARDGALRDSSFYDNVVMWKTIQLADKMDISPISDVELASLRTKIITTFWDNEKGYFKDDQHNSEYSSDWLIALPTGFLVPSNPDDHDKLKRAIAYTRDHRIDQPFPIRYTETNNDVKAPWAVRTFVPNYGGNAIWSYWGAEYISLLGKMYHIDGTESYKQDAEKFIAIYRAKIAETRGFPETFDSEGNFLQNTIYKSIRQTGWVVQFESAEATLSSAKK